jgi:oxepin-CoA hydrolase/3-oxo-5,6-dehydrosuberyl-CoA semialdehyde dehydrogenase
MEFLAWDLELILTKLQPLKENALPAWGNFSAQRMVEHLNDGLRMSMGEITFPLEVPEEKLPKNKLFLHSENPFPKDLSVNFVKPETKLRNEELELAIDELTESILRFEAFYEDEPNAHFQHPHFGNLNHGDWTQLHRKHFHHHFLQFGLLD